MTKYKNDRERMEAILSLLIDKKIGELEASGQLVGDKEVFGALVFAGHTFKQAYRIANAK